MIRYFFKSKTKEEYLCCHYYYYYFYFEKSIFSRDIVSMENLNNLYYNGISIKEQIIECDLDIIQIKFEYKKICKELL